MFYLANVNKDKIETRIYENYKLAHPCKKILFFLTIIWSSDLEILFLFTVNFKNVDVITEYFHL